MRKNGGEGRSRRVSSFQIYRNKKWVSSLYRTAQPNTLALFPTWGSQRELVVKDLPTAKIAFFSEDLKPFVKILHSLLIINRKI